MRNAEKKCCRLKSGRIPFSSESALWICHTQMYCLLLRYHGEFTRNRENLKRSTRECGIDNCLSLLVEEILQWLKACLKHCDHFRHHGKHYRWKHLKNCLHNAQESEDEQREKKIRAIIQCEKDHSFWRRINYNAMGKARNGSVWRVLVENRGQEGVLTKNTTQELVQEAIFQTSTTNSFSSQRQHLYAMADSGDSLGTMPSSRHQGPSSTDHTISPQTLIRLQRKSVWNVLKFGR